MIETHLTTGLPKPMRSHKIGNVGTPILAEVDTGSVVIGVALIVLIGAIMIAVIIRFDFDSVLKMWAGLGTLTGLLVGIMGTYFFTKDQIEQKDSQIRLTQNALRQTQRDKAQLETELLAHGIKRDRKFEDQETATGTAEAPAEDQGAQAAPPPDATPETDE